MRGKILFLTGMGVGYVLGTKAGRERYNQIKRTASTLWSDPRVQQRVDQVEDFVKEKGPEVAEFVGDNAKKLASQVTGRGSSTSGSGSTAKSTRSTRSSAAKSSTAKSSTAKGSSSSSSS
ncbi:YtxH domain-containing protein [Microcella flavibacter]|uniref:YtxH domain-containing protein n=1 Tax=Microcella flavibacter TaxID=1804990 RepID=UPI001E445188|nr:YtxH domain-containing protein [Microcella flavibacter]